MVAQGEGGWFRWVEERASHTHGALLSPPLCLPSQATCRHGGFALALSPLCKKGDLWLRLAGGEEKRENIERTLFLNYLRPLHPTGSHPVPFKEELFLHKHIFLPRSQPLLPIQFPVLGLGSSIPNGGRDTVGLGPRPWMGLTRWGLRRPQAQ